MAKLTIDRLDVAGKRVLMRVDFNVPIADGKVDNDKRIVAALPTIQHVLDAGGSLVLMSHLGRPKGERKPEFSLRPVAECLAQHLGREVGFVDDCIGDEVQARAEALKPGELLLVENLRFYAAEQKPDKDPSFATQLAALGDLYVNDAFGTAHRAHSSMVAVAEQFEQRAAGFLLAKELEYFGKALAEPARPFVAVLGGALVGKANDERSRWRIDTIIEQIDRITNVMESLLNLARPRAPVHEAVDLRAVIETALSFLQEKLRRRNIELETQLKDLISSMFVLDAVRRIDVESALEHPFVTST